jgi:Tfp pilus assembly protein PilO
VSGAWLTRWRSRLSRPLFWLLAANLVAALVYTLPRTLQQRSLAEQGAALRADVERERRLLQRLTERVEASEANARDLAAFYKDVLKERGQLVSVLKDLDEQAPSRGSRTTRPVEVKGAAVSRFVVTMPLSGSYEQLVAFLRMMERSSHFVTVDRISLREKEQAGQLDVDLSIYLRAAAEKG